MNLAWNPVVVALAAALTAPPSSEDDALVAPLIKDENMTEDTTQIPVSQSRNYSGISLFSGRNFLPNVILSESRLRRLGGKSREPLIFRTVLNRILASNRGIFTVYGCEG